MSAGQGLRLATLAVLLLVAVLLLARSPASTTYAIDLPNAAGLLVDDEVRMSGVQVGKVTRLRVTPATTVVVTLSIRKDAGPLGRDARAEVRAANLFGGKYLALLPGDRRHPMAPGATIPAARTSAPVEIDQVLDTLDAGTRARVATLIDEAGVGLAARGHDLSTTLAQMPGTLAQSTAVARQLGSDTRSLGRLVERSDRVVASFARQRHELAGLVNTADGAFRAPGARPGRSRGRCARRRRCCAGCAHPCSSCGPRRSRSALPPTTCGPPRRRWRRRCSRSRGSSARRCRCSRRHGARPRGSMTSGSGRRPC